MIDNLVYPMTPGSVIGGVQITSKLSQGSSPVVQPTVYGIHISDSVSSPSSKITYLEDAVGMIPAHMDFMKDEFDYGDWGSAFFMPRPCMLKYDGTVDYYLDPNDYSKKEDGSASDVANSSYEGNAMMEWGQNGKKIWLKIQPDEGDSYSASIYVSDQQVDSGYTAWSFTNSDNDLVSHFYTSIYNGAVVSGKLRSLSGIAKTEVAQSLTLSDEIAYARANNPSTYNIWDTEVFSDSILINVLLLLMSKSTDSQAVFGKGRTNQPKAATSIIGTGTMDNKGLFWGSSDTSFGVKVFGMENWWGNQMHRIAGLIYNEGVLKIKLTQGTADGSTVSDYNQTGEGYRSYELNASGTNGQVIEHMLYKDGFFIPETVSGTTSINYCDSFWFTKTLVRYGMRGGHLANTYQAGALYITLNDENSATDYRANAAPSCKPRAV